jgi:nitrate/nitrite transporter NarK
MGGRAVDRSRGSLAARALFTAILAVAMATSTFFGYAFGVLGPFIIDEFDISRSQFGLLSTVFFVVGGGASLPAGRLVDRMGAWRV